MIENLENLEEDLSVVDLTEVIDEFKEFNKKFGWGETLASFVINNANRPETGDLEEGNFSDEHSAENAMTFTALSDRVSPLLSRVGLMLEQVDGSGRLYTSEGQFSASEVRVNIEDGEKFVEYLTSLKSDEPSESQKKALVDISKMLSKQLETNYDLMSGEDDRFLEFASHLGNISSKYKELDIEFGADEYVEPLKGRYLKEYLQAKQLNLHKDFSSKEFNLRWHTDCNKEFLEQKWNLVIDTLQTIFENENATSLYDIASQTAKTAIDQAIEDVSAWDETKDDHYEKNKEIFLGILNSVKNRLLEF